VSPTLTYDLSNGSFGIYMQLRLCQIRQ